jgi:hypothetical protein
MKKRDVKNIKTALTVAKDLFENLGNCLVLSSIKISYLFHIHEYCNYFRSNNLLLDGIEDKPGIKKKIIS